MSILLSEDYLWDIIILLKFVILVLTVIWLYGDMDAWIGHGTINNNYAESESVKTTMLNH